ncbi:CHAT domain-containing protein [Micromonospora saelicesensis]|uniref:CHAT domain-containing protein n=1 Tax=Micromonospora saelicesensis TaxID=285676 RepID=UPI003CEAD75C
MFSLGFTSALTDVVEAAPRIAHTTLHNVVAPEHLLRAVLHSDASTARPLLDSLSGTDLLAAWQTTWPDGVRAPRGIPPLSPLAKACLEYASGAARLREASLVTTADLVKVILHLDDPGVDEFLERTGLTADGFVSARKDRSALQSALLAGCVTRPAAEPAPGAIGGILARELTLPYDISDEDGPIAQILRTAGRQAPGNPVDTVAILAAVQRVDPILAHPMETVLVHARADSHRESGMVPVDVGGERLHLSAEAAYAIGCALMLRDCYRIPYVRFDLIAAGLILTSNSRVRRAFEAMLLTGLTTTRSHIEAMSAHTFADLPAIVRSISHSLTGILPPATGAALVSLQDERWDVRDADPLDVLDTLRRAFEADANDPGALDVALDRMTQGLGDSNHDVAFRTIALQGLWLAELARGDRRSAAEITRRLQSLARGDRWTARRIALNDWLPHRLRTAVEEDGAVDGHAADLLRVAGPKQVLRHLEIKDIQPSWRLLTAMTEQRERAAAPMSVFGQSGYAEAVVALVADNGLARAAAAIRSRRLLSRMSMAIDEEPDRAALFAMVEDTIADSGFAFAEELLRNLQAAPVPLDAAGFQSELLRLGFVVSQAMGSDYEGRYLIRLLSAHHLVASRAEREEERDAANAMSRHALALLVVMELCASRFVSPLVRLLHQWWQTATESRLEAECQPTAGSIAVRMAAAAIPRKGEFVALLTALSGSADKVTDRWVKQVSRTLGILLPEPDQGHYLSPRHPTTDHDELERAVTEHNAAGAAAADDRSVQALERLLASSDDLIRIAGLGDADTIVTRVKDLLALQRCTDVTDRTVAAASRLHAQMCELVERRVTEPTSNWDLVVDAWVDAARRAGVPESQVRQRQFALVARGYQHADSHEERHARGNRLKLVADALSRALLAEGQPQDAALVTEMASDLEFHDRAAQWKPPAAIDDDIGAPLSIDGSTFSSPYALSFAHSAQRHVEPDTWLATRRTQVTADPWRTPRPVLIIVPGRHGGHVLALDDDQCSGWAAPALNNELATRLLPALTDDSTDRAWMITALRDALPPQMHAWAAQRSEVSLLSRGWCTLVPVHAALLGEPGTPGPVLSYTSSLNRLTTAVEAARTHPAPPSRAVVVTEPGPSTMAAVWHSGAEHTALTANVTAKMLRGSSAVRGQVLDAIAGGPDVFHFGGPAHFFGLLLAHDTALTASEVRHLPAGPSRAAVLAGGTTAFPDIHHDGDTMVDAFRTLGCPAVIGCLWRTDDLADSLLIDAFYRDAAATNWMSPPASLQKAAAWLRAATWPQCAARLNELYGDDPSVRPPDSPHPYADPRHWAGYLCFGA